MKNKKYKKRIYTKSERSSSAKEYLAIIGRQLKRPIEKQDRWIDKKSAILAVVTVTDEPKNILESDRCSIVFCRLS